MFRQISGPKWEERGGTRDVAPRPALSILVSRVVSRNSGFVIDFATPSLTAPPNIAIAFDNFKVNAGTVVCPQ